jgi:hypothetical protein
LVKSSSFAFFLPSASPRKSQSKNEPKKQPKGNPHVFSSAHPISLQVAAMSLPASVTLANLSGKYIFNSKQSGPTEPPLKAQGVSWVTRKAIVNSTLYITLIHKPAADGQTEQAQAKQEVGSIGKSEEEYILTDTWAEKEHTVFKHIKAKANRVPVSELPYEYLKQGWIESEMKDGCILVESHSDKDKNPNDWHAWQVWGIAEIDGERKFIRRNKLIGDKGKVDIELCLVYDYTGAL